MDAIRSHAQLLRVMTPSALRHAIATGEVHRVQRGQYSLGVPPDHRMRLRALQRSDPTAIASHLSAALLLGIVEEPPASLHVTVPHEIARRSSTGLIVHRSRRAIPAVVVGGIRCTASVRTVLDLARWCPHPEGLVHADAALQRGLVDRATLLRAAPSVRRLDGAARARRAISMCRPGAESPMETRLRALLVQAGVPEPCLQHLVTTSGGSFRLDLAWPDQRVAVEYDGYQWHADRTRFSADRRRWRVLAAAGWDVHPVTGADLARPAELSRSIHAAIHRRSR